MSKGCLYIFTLCGFNDRKSPRDDQIFGNWQCIQEACNIPTVQTCDDMIMTMNDNDKLQKSGPIRCWPGTGCLLLFSLKPGCFEKESDYSNTLKSNKKSCTILKQFLKIRSRLFQVGKSWQIHSSGHQASSMLSLGSSSMTSSVETRSANMSKFRSFFSRNSCLGASRPISYENLHKSTL